MGLGRNNIDQGLDDGDDRHSGKGGNSFDSVCCSICLETVVDNGHRSWSNLKCGHQFHLDCIASAFNVKGSMQCPNCREIEEGGWLYSDGSGSFPKFSFDEVLYNVSYYFERAKHELLEDQIGNQNARFDATEAYLRASQEKMTRDFTYLWSVLVGAGVVSPSMVPPEFAPSSQDQPLLMFGHPQHQHPGSYSQMPEMTYSQAQQQQQPNSSVPPSQFGMNFCPPQPQSSQAPSGTFAINSATSKSTDSS